MSKGRVFTAINGLIYTYATIPTFALSSIIVTLGSAFVLPHHARCFLAFVTIESASTSLHIMVIYYYKQILANTVFTVNTSIFAL